MSTSKLHMDYKKGSKTYICKCCDYSTTRNSQWNRHITTAKHLWMTSVDGLVPNHNHICSCGAQYKTRQGLWKHSKTCSEPKGSPPPEPTDDLKTLSDLVMNVVKQNQELTNKIVDICKTTQINNVYNSVNSYNKTFNLNVFLNETCKDAMNITEFVDSLKPELSDFENVGRLGYVDGIATIILKNLKALEVHKRPVHCSDIKREIMYIKDEDKWERENDDKNKLKKIIKKIADKNARLLPEFKAKHPDCVQSFSPFSDQYNTLIIESMGGIGDNDVEKGDKIIRKIAKEVAIDKNNDF